MSGGNCSSRSNRKQFLALLLHTFSVLIYLQHPLFPPPDPPCVLLLFTDMVCPGRGPAPPLWLSASVFLFTKRYISRNITRMQGRVKEDKSRYNIEKSSPVRICLNASSTPVESRADVSMNANRFDSAKDMASSVVTARRWRKSL